MLRFCFQKQYKSRSVEDEEFRMEECTKARALSQSDDFDAKYEALRTYVHTHMQWPTKSCVCTFKKKDGVSVPFNMGKWVINKRYYANGFRTRLKGGLFYVRNALMQKQFLMIDGVHSECCWLRKDNGLRPQKFRNVYHNIKRCINAY